MNWEEILLGNLNKFLPDNLVFLMGFLYAGFQVLTKFRGSWDEFFQGRRKLETDKLRFEVLRLKLEVMRLGGEKVQEQDIRAEIGRAFGSGLEPPSDRSVRKDMLLDLMQRYPRYSLALLIPANTVLSVIGLPSALISLVFYISALSDLAVGNKITAGGDAVNATVFLIIAWLFLIIPYRSFKAWRALRSRKELDQRRGKALLLVGALISFGLSMVFGLVIVGAQSDSISPSPTPSAVFVTEETIMPSATPTSTPTPMPAEQTPTSEPSSVVDILNNGSFERDATWIFKPTVRQGGYSSNEFHSGLRSARVGITDPNFDAHSFSSVSQRVQIPADAHKATLIAHLYPISDDIYGRDLQLTLILDQNFREIERLSSNLSNERVWQKQTFDLTKYAGRTIYIYFGVVNRVRDGRTTALYVDDVALLVEK